MNYKLINQFNTCWIPDEKENPSLAGKLSHPKKLPAIPVIYIGLQSRFEKISTPMQKDRLLIILSGPEPQRTLFEKIILRELNLFTAEAVVLRGLPTSKEIIPSTDKIKFYNHLGSKLLNEEMAKAEFVISRSGYSTVMDIMKLNKKSILIPTPGQTEQQYLAAHLLENQFSYCTSQKKFSLLQTLEVSKRFSYQTIS